MTVMTYDSASSRPQLRLTRRGRTVIVLVLAMLVLVAFSLGRVSSEASRDDAPVVRPTVVVQPGDTLWQIARRTAPGADRRRMVARISQLNDLGARPLQAGQRLVLPG